jgi:hypothetical protein
MKFAGQVAAFRVIDHIPANCEVLKPQGPTVQSDAAIRRYLDSLTRTLPGLVGGRRGVEHGLELIQHPVNLLLGDDQRRCESNRDVVGLLC